MDYPYELQLCAARICACVAEERTILDKMTIIGRDAGYQASMGMVDDDDGDKAINLTIQLADKMSERADLVNEFERRAREEGVLP